MTGRGVFVDPGEAGMNPEIHIIVRTRYVAEIDKLLRLGANEVIPEEFETSIEIFARVLHEYHLPRNLIALQIELIRREGYGMLRGLRLEGKSLARVSQYLVGSTADTFLVQEGSEGERYAVHGTTDYRPQTTDYRLPPSVKGFRVKEVFLLSQSRGHVVCP